MVRAEGEKRTEGEGEFAIGLCANHGGHTNNRANAGRDKNSEKNGTPAEKSADHGQQFDISSTHSFSAGERLVAERDRQKKTSPNHCAD